MLLFRIVHYIWYTTGKITLPKGVVSEMLWCIPANPKMNQVIKLSRLLFISTLILTCSLNEVSAQSVNQSDKFINGFLNKLIELPKSKKELKTYLDIPSNQEVGRFYHEYIEDYKIESFDESSLIYSVLVKPRQDLDEVDGDWTTRLQFKLSIVDEDTLLMPSIMNRVARSYWKKNEISENKNPRVDYRKKWVQANIYSWLQYEDVLDDIQKQDMRTIWSRKVYDGIFGKNYSRIGINFENLTKKNDTYEVTGFTVLKDKKVQFTGTIKPIKAITHNDNESDIPPVTVISEYEFQEEGSDNGSFSGIVVSMCYFKNEQLVKDDRGSVAAGYRNNTYVGVWTNAAKTNNYKCIWGDGRLPYTTDFDIGTSETYVNDKYKKNGWDN